jgi:hypothetical protein
MFCWMVTDVHYLVGRQTRNAETAMTAIIQLLALMQICSVDRNVLEQAIALGTSDFEDAVQVACAMALGLDAIVTRETIAGKSRSNSSVAAPFVKQVEIHTANNNPESANRWQSLP